MNKFGKLSALLLVLVFCLSLLPGTVLADEPEEEPIFFAAMMSKAGPGDHMTNTVSAEWYGYQEKLGDDYLFSDFLKTRLMTTAMDLRSDAASFFIPQYLSKNGGSYHELTLFSHQEIDPAAIELVGVQTMGEIEKHVVGDVDSAGNDGRLWWYTVPLFVPDNDFDLEICVGGETDAVIPIIHPSGVGDSFIALVTTMQVYDYAESEPGVFDSLTLRLSGFYLPKAAEAYQIGDAYSEESVLYTASALTEEDEYGYRYVTFDFDGNVTADDFMWWGLRFNHITFFPETEYEFKGYQAWFFDKYNDVIYDEGTGTYSLRWSYDGEEWDYEKETYTVNPIFWLQGVKVEVPTPYYCMYKTPDFGETPPQPAEPKRPSHICIGAEQTELVDGDNVTYWKRADTYMGVVPATAEDWNLRYEPVTDLGEPRLTLRNFVYTGAGSTDSVGVPDVVSWAPGQTSGVLFIRGGEALTIAFEGENSLVSTGGADYYRHCIYNDSFIHLTFSGGENDSLYLSTGPDELNDQYLSAAINCGSITVTGGTVTADGSRHAGCVGVSMPAQEYPGWEGGPTGTITVLGGLLIAKGSARALRVNSGDYIDECTDYALREGTTVVTASPNADGSAPVPFVHDDVQSYHYMEFAPDGAQPAVPGDLDGNGRVEKADVIVLFVRISTAAPEDLPDLTGDGCVNSRDALLLFRRTAQYN